MAIHWQKIVDGALACCLIGLAYGFGSRVLTVLGCGPVWSHGGHIVYTETRGMQDWPESRVQKATLTPVEAETLSALPIYKTNINM